MRWLAILALLAATPAAARDSGGRWITGWAAAQQEPDLANRLPAGPSTLRQVVRVTTSGAKLRVRLSNVFGTAPLVVTGVHVGQAAASGSSAVRQGTDRAVSFNGSSAVTVPAGAEYWSDPVALSVSARDSIAVSLALVVPATGQTLHTAAHATSFLAQGDQASMADLPGATRVERWGFLSGIDTLDRGIDHGIVAFGDSITDGSKSTTDGNDRWPDILSDRLRTARATGNVAVLNLGIGGNRLLADGNGPSALKRFDRDVLGQAGVRALIVLEGVNDVGTLTRDGPVSTEAHATLVTRIVGAYRQIVLRAHRRGLKVYGGTLTPFVGFAAYADPASERDRAEVNRRIREEGVFDAVIDFDRMLRDPARPDRLLPAYDSGDHLHPSPAGYRRMGEGIALTLFASGGRQRIAR